MNHILTRSCAVLIVVILVIPAFLAPTHALASCMAGTADVYRSATTSGNYVFLGTITKVDPSSHTFSQDGHLQTNTYAIQAHVERVWGVSTSYSDVNFSETVPGADVFISDKPTVFTVGTREVVWMQKNADGTFSSSQGGCSLPLTADTISDEMKADGVVEGTVVPLYRDKTCPVVTLTRTLSKGMRDTATTQDVTSLQAYLANKYGLSHTDTVTGYFGLATQKNVMRFQKENSLPITGTVGPLTRKAIANNPC